MPRVGYRPRVSRGAWSDRSGFSPSSGNADRRARPVRHEPRPEDRRDQVPDVVVAAGLAAVQVEGLAMAGAHEPDDALRIGLRQVRLLRTTAPLDVHLVAPTCPEPRSA